MQYYAINNKSEAFDLKHYGVLGMKWGVIRWRKNLESAHKTGNTDKAIKSVKKLEKHKTKIINKMDEYDKQLLKLKQEATKHQKKREKIANYEYKIAKNTLKSIKSDDDKKQEKLANKNIRLNSKIATLQNEIKETEDAIQDLTVTKSLFSDYLSMIDESLSTTGKEYVKMLQKQEEEEGD